MGDALRGGALNIFFSAYAGIRRQTTFVLAFQQVDWPALQAMFRESRLTSSSYIFTEGMANWALATTLNLDGPEPINVT